MIHEITEKKGKDIVAIDLSGLPNAFCTYFIVCTGDSSTQVDALSDGIERGLREACRLHPWSVQGRENRQWILMDYGDIIVHIFQPETRRYYRLEELWADGVTQRYDDAGNPM